VITPQEELRAGLVKFLEWELLGPGAKEEILDESPRKRYSAGILFPGGHVIDETDDVTNEEISSFSHDDEDDVNIINGTNENEGRETGGEEENGDVAYDDPVQLANAYFPAAIGLSFMAEINNNGLVFEPRAAIYESFHENDKKNVNNESTQTASCEKKSDHSSQNDETEINHAEENSSSSSWISQKWKRRELPLSPVTVDINAKKGKPLCKNIKISDGLELQIISRRKDEISVLVTASLYNSFPSENSRPPSVSKCFFQVGLKVHDSNNSMNFLEYRMGRARHDDPEEQSLELLYRNRKSFAIGHGCAATWNEPQNGRTNLLETSILPKVKIPPVEPRSGPGDEYSMYLLSGGEGTVLPNKIPKVLHQVEISYKAWINERRKEVNTLPVSYRKRANEHLDKCDECHERIKSGIELLEKDNILLEGFMLANQAMLMQQVHYRRKRRTLDEQMIPLPKTYKPENDHTGRWRCFQIAFILMNLTSLVSNGKGGNQDPRNIIDLIWFPTGGGKTEAYLGLAACTIFLRRLRNPANAGCTVLMRYTLRLLTSQQFQRASTMVCACEIIRRQDEDKFGHEPISIGLWVGSTLTPNNRVEARKALNEWVGGRGENKFQILTCPWCGTEMDNIRNPGYTQVGKPVTVRYVCREKQCPFSNHRNPLPVTVIDEDIYDHPTTLVIGTVDKFAMLAWNDKSGSILGLDGAVGSGLDLIIQDELHLISGPLGSLVGLYESVIDLLSSHNSRPPKIVASTATIRKAVDQCRNLYNRDTFIFPPSGLDVSDSYFALEKKNAPGRLYIGVLGSAAPSFTTLQLRTIAALLQGIKHLPLPAGSTEACRDPYWTIIWYFNSLRELGHASTLVEADICEYLGVIARRLSLRTEDRRSIGHPVEMTGRRSAEEIPTILGKLSNQYPDENVIDTLLATNMISVGVDISRLGLMVVTGQPKTTSEYIQATSRVGRGDSSAGLVIATYAPGKPRDRSHYEQFRSYHETFYQFVEPTSVTPFSLPAMERALHALIVIVVRHICELGNPREFNLHDVAVEDLRKWLCNRCEQIEIEHVEWLKTLFDELCRTWEAVRPKKWQRWEQNQDNERVLMFPAGKPANQDDLWPTLTSLRNVDVECKCQIIQQYTLPRKEIDD
jgi:hypothetical protein